MAASTDNVATQPSASSDHSVPAAASTVAPLKRKHSPSSPRSNDEGDEQTVAPSFESAEPMPNAVDDPTTYGVYQHNVLDGSGQDGAILTVKSATCDDAHKVMRDHARQIIDGNLHWGATTERTMDKIYEIIDSRQHVQLRYDISPIFTVETSADSTAIWQRGKAPNTPPKRYGIYFSLHSQDDGKVQTTESFQGGYTNLTEAAHAMSISARMYLARNSGSTVRESRIDLIDGAGRIAQRFWIEEGRLVDGRFVKEDEWKTMLDQGGEKDATVAPAVKGKEKRHSVLRMPSPDAATPQASPSTGSTPPPPEQPTSSRASPTADATLPQPDQTSTLPTPPPKDQAAVPDDDDDDEDPSRPWCSCRQPDDGSTMLCCSNENECPMKWYHARCLGFAKAKKGWLCATCDPAKKNVKTAKKVGKKPAPKMKGKGKGKGKASGGGGGTKKRKTG